MGRWAALLVACACGGGVFAQSNSAPTEVNSFHQFYGLTSEQALKGMPVRIKGVIVCYDPGWGQMYVYDGTETAWLNPQNFQTNLTAGLSVELTGATTFTQGYAAFTNLHARVLGPIPLPPAKQLDGPQLINDFGQWVQTSGRVRVAEISQQRLSLVIQDKGQTCLVYVLGSSPTNDFKSLLGCNVRVRGINASKIADGKLQSATLFASGLEGVTVIERPAAQPAEMPVTSIDALLNRELGSWTNAPVHLNGPVMSYKPGDSVTFKDATGFIRARVIQTTIAQAGDRVDVWGYLAITPGETYLRDAYFEIQRPIAPVVVPVAASEPPAGQTNSLPEITRFSTISRMRPEEASQGFPVRLRGIVTYADPDWHNCFVQGQSGAIYVELSQKDIAAGQLVEITGQTSPGGFAPEVLNATARILATTNLPAPIKTDLEELAGGHLDSHWVQLEGVVRRVTEQWGHETLYLTSPKGRFKAVVLKPNDQTSSSNLIDALVSVQGACTSEMNTHGQLTGVSLRVPGFDQIKTLEAAPADPFAVPTAAIRSVATFDPSRLAGRRVRVSGSVTVVLPGQGFYIQDDSGGIRVNSTETNNLQTGDLVDILGFPAMGDFSPYLEEVTFKNSGKASLPKPEVTTAEEILSQGTNDAVVVRIKANLVQSVAHSAHPKLVLQSGTIIFTAALANQTGGRETRSFPVGSLLEVAGVAAIQGGENHEPESFRLLVPGSQDIVLISTPPWWTIQHTLMLAGGLALGGLLAWGWIHSLRRQVRAQTEVIRQNQEELIAVSRQAGMAEVATAVLHNVGNVLNSVNVSASVTKDALRASKGGNVSLVADMMKANAADLGNFLTNDPKGRRLPEYLAQLGEHLEAERLSALAELESLSNNIQHINDIVATQQTHAKVGGIIEKVKIGEIIEDAIRMNLSALECHSIRLLREYDVEHSPEITVEKHKVLQILINLVSNAKYACSDSDQRQRCLTVRVTNGDDRLKISCVDNGIGISSENLTRIFTYGFTTRKSGHGFGLHSAALAAKQMGGSLLAHSEGSGKGATFTLELPCSPKKS